MEIVDQMVDYDKFCKSCKHRKLKGHYDPCNDCLDNPANTNTNKPMYYEKDEDVKDEEEE